MESKDKKVTSAIYKLIFIAAVFCLTLQACWTFESSIKVKDVLFDNFKIIEDKNDEKAGFVLVLNHDEEFFETIEEHCQEIFFDSVNIYVKSISNPPIDSSFKYHYIKVISRTLENKKADFKNQELTLSEFNWRVEKCNKCVKKNYQ